MTERTLHWNTDIMLYLASPYSPLEPTDPTMDQRLEEAERATAWLYKQGYMTFSPIIHCHRLARNNNLPHGFDYWMPLDYRFIRGCDIVCVLTTPGWKRSKGVTAEVRYALNLSKPRWALIPQANGEYLLDQAPCFAEIL